MDIRVIRDNLIGFQAQVENLLAGVKGTLGQLQREGISLVMDEAEPAKTRVSKVRSSKDDRVRNGDSPGTMASHILAVLSPSQALALEDIAVAVRKNGYSRGEPANDLKSLGPRLSGLAKEGKVERVGCGFWKLAKASKFNPAQDVRPGSMKDYILKYTPRDGKPRHFKDISEIIWKSGYRGSQNKEMLLASTNSTLSLLRRMGKAENSGDGLWTIKTGA